MHRNIYTEIHINDLEQGAIFNGALSENYKGKDVHGIIITPRCDISNNKVAYFNYLPVVSFQDWLINDFWFFFRQQILSMLKNSLKTICNNKNISSNIIDKFEPDFIQKHYQSYFPKQKELNKFNELINGINEIMQCSDVINDKRLLLFMNKYDKQTKSILTELSNNRNPNFHLIESWHNEGEYYIILLREINKISYDLGISLHKGIETDGLSEKLLLKNDIDRKTDLIYLEKVLKSPYIEHLIQRFTGNFGKIGVEDHYNDLTNYLFNYYSK